MKPFIPMIFNKTKNKNLTMHEYQGIMSHKYVVFIEIIFLSDDGHFSLLDITRNTNFFVCNFDNFTLDSPLSFPTRLITSFLFDYRIKLTCFVLQTTSLAHRLGLWSANTKDIVTGRIQFQQLTGVVLLIFAICLRFQSKANRHTVTYLRDNVREFR